jgi:ADP-ribosylation factor family
MSEIEIRDVRSLKTPFKTVTYAIVVAGRFQALDLRSIQSHQWKILPCSAVSGHNLIEGLDWVVNDVASRLYYGSTTVHESPELVSVM